MEFESAMANLAARGWTVVEHFLTPEEARRLAAEARRLQLAELENIVRSPAAATNLAENYVGVPLPEPALAVPWAELAKKRGRQNGQDSPADLSAQARRAS